VLNLYLPVDGCGCFIINNLIQIYKKSTKLLGACGESRIRTHETISRLSVFKTDAIDQLCHLS